MFPIVRYAHVALQLAQHSVAMIKRAAAKAVVTPVYCKERRNVEDQVS